MSRRDVDRKDRKRVRSTVVPGRSSSWVITRTYDRDDRYLVVETKPTEAGSLTHSYVIPREPLNLEVPSH